MDSFEVELPTTGPSKAPEEKMVASPLGTSSGSETDLDLFSPPKAKRVTAAATEESSSVAEDPGSVESPGELDEMPKKSGKKASTRKAGKPKATSTRKSGGKSAHQKLAVLKKKLNAITASL
jgi:hypothetical protein